MLIAEALVLRSEYKTLLSNLERRIRKNSKVYEEGDNPNENLENLIKEYSEVREKLRDLIIKINHTNLTTKLPNGMFVADAIAYKNALMDEKNMLDSIMHESMGSSYRDEKTYPVMDIKDIQKEISKFSKEYREVNTAIQLSNWQTSLD